MITSTNDTFTDTNATSTPEQITTQTGGDVLNGEEAREIKSDEQYISIDAKYPKFSDSNISKSVKDFVVSSIASFKIENNIDNLTQTDKDFIFQNGAKYQYNVDYKTYTTDTLGTVVVLMANYTGGAHGNLVVKSLNYNNNSQQLTIGDLFQPESDYLTRLSEISRQKLPAVLGDNIGAWSDDGTAPTSDNFQTFYMKDKNTLNIVFQPYQVAPWVAGSPEISIDIPSELSDIINPQFLNQ